MRKPNYHQQRKARLDARKVRQAIKQERRAAPTTEPVAAGDASGVDSTRPADTVPDNR
jgi:hypothetical protein